MVSYLLSLLVFLSYSAWVIQSYYVDYSHAEPRTAWYWLWLLAGWATYKSWTQWKGARTGEAKVGRWTIPVLVAAQVLVACLWFAADQMGGQYGMTLFFKIVGWSALPVLVTAVSWAFGSKLAAWALPTPGAWQVRALLSMGAGFAALLTAWAGLGAVGLLSGWSFFLLLAAMAAVSWRAFAPMARWWGGSYSVRTHSLSGDVSDFVRLRELTSEWFFIVLCTVLASNLVNIVRSMPIGWDDLGSYMNWPKLIAQDGGLLHGAGIFSWQAFTSVGFLLGSPTQAFFLSCLGGVLGVAAVWLAVSHAQAGRKAGVDLAMMSAIAIYATPMVVFQQAKDMKLDMGLLALTVAGAYPLIALVVSEFRSGRWTAPSALRADVPADPNAPGVSWRAYALVGLVLGAAFAVKVTTLITFVAVFSLLTAAAGGWIAFLGWCLMVAGGFYVTGAWTMMMLPIPSGNFAFMAAAYVAAAGALLVAWSVFRYWANWRKGAAAAVVSLALGATVAMVPWFGMNAFDALSAGKPLSVSSLLSGYSSDWVRPNLAAIYSSGQIAEKVAAEVASAKRDDGRTTNEDWGRYFGYEYGMNNYAKLPWNMSMQANQRGEFTDITYLFLVLFPGSLLFLAYRRKAWVVVVFAAAAAAYPLFVFQPAFTPLAAVDASVVTGATKYFTDDRSVLVPQPFSPDIYDIDWRGKGFSEPEAFYDGLVDRLRRGDANRPSGWPDADWKAYMAALDKYARISFKEGVSLGSIRADASLSPQMRGKLEALRFSNRSWNQALTDGLSLVELPAGYGLLAGVALLFLGFLAVAPRRSPDTQEFRAHAFFLVPYCLLFTAVAFAVPWYGIMMYFCLLAMAVPGLSEMTSETGAGKERAYRLLGGVVLTVAVSVYFLESALPHAAGNLKSAGFVTYKAGMTTAAQDSILNRNGYLAILSELNLAQPRKVFADAMASLAASPDASFKYVAELAARNGVGSGSSLETGVRFLAAAVDKLRASDLQGRFELQARAAEGALNGLLDKIITPSAQERNEAKIFRLGTFLSYFISQNRQRFWDDSLVTWFGRYAADADPDVSAERLKKMGFTYVLADLNAATIDKDPRHDLTNRFEGLLWSFSSRKLDLVYTDNLCLKVARDVAGLGREEFLSLAGTNYDSWTPRYLSRADKQRSCGQYVAQLLTTGEASAVPSLAGLAQQAKGKSADEVAKIAAGATAGTTWMAVFKIK